MFACKQASLRVRHNLVNCCTDCVHGLSEDGLREAARLAAAVEQGIAS